MAQEKHDTDVLLRGRVLWAGCAAEICMLEVGGDEARGPTVLVRHHGALEGGAEAFLGHAVEIEGRFFIKIYPGYRMMPWQALGWRAGSTLPARARIPRVDARRLERLPGGALAPAPLEPLVAPDSPLFDLTLAEFEEGGLGTGRKCLQVGEETPSHSTGSHQEMLLGLEGRVRIEIPGLAPFDLEPMRGFFIAPGTPHAIGNPGPARACYLFVHMEPTAGTRP
jgi:quercetin dioxygenase-like cupin family protein